MRHLLCMAVTNVAQSTWERTCFHVMRQSGCKPGPRRGGVWKKGEVIMAKVIEFYIPNTFRKRAIWIPPEQRGKVIEFPLQIKKSA